MRLMERCSSFFSSSVAEGKKFTPSTFYFQIPGVYDTNNTIKMFSLSHPLTKRDPAVASDLAEL
jgi:hypothetical protein